MNKVINSLLFFAVIFLFSCANNDRTQADKSAMTQKSLGANPPNGEILFQDSMADNWQDKWFLDGEKATLEHRDGGLYFSGGTITKEQDNQEYHAHHAVLWTKQVFEGDLFIRFEMTRIDNSNYGNTLLYIQAQGIGHPPYVPDIQEWNEMRTIPAMDKYFTYMSLLSVSFRENIRCKRYPLRDVKGNVYEEALFKPMLEYDGIQPRKSYTVEVEKKNPYLTLRLYDTESKKLIITHNWDITKNPATQMPRLIEKGRIGLRHMSTKQFLYKNFVVRSL